MAMFARSQVGETEMKKPSALTKMRSQWAAQFLTAGEMVRRGHLASFTIGNTPGIDLLCISPYGTQFAVQCKGGIKPSFWLMRQPRKDIYYVLVYLPEPDEPAKFFIMTGAQALKKWTKREKYHAELIRTKGPRKLWPCIMLKDAKQYENCWGTLPK
jgi:hypothetical protein